MENSSIFIQIAAYRDPELKSTLKDLLEKAFNPARLKICIAWQHSEEDTWDELSEYQGDPRFNIIDIPYQESKGACWARNTIQQHYAGEDFTLQIDSHTRFIQDWDKEMIEMLKSLQEKGHQKPLITGYLPGYIPQTDPDGRTMEVWQMNFDRFAPEGYIFTRPGVMPDWEKREEPLLCRFYSAHFAFTLGIFSEEVQHDPDMYFHGEEPSIAARAWTHGYDLFHPHKILAWHEYTREGKKKHWDDVPSWPQLNNNSFARYRLMHGMDGLTCSPCARKQIGKYFFGEVRSLEEYEKFAGVKFSNRTVTQSTKDGLVPPVDPNEEYLSLFKHCIDLHISEFPEEDYDFWVVSFEKADGTNIMRLDAGEEEIETLKIQSTTDNGWMRLWREYQGPAPDKYVIWAHSKSKEWLNRKEVFLR